MLSEHQLLLDQSLPEWILRPMVEGLPVNIIVKDVAGKFLYVNRETCRLIGRSPDEIIGKTDFDLFPHELAGNLDSAQRDQVRTILASGESLLELLNDILDFSRIESGRIELDTVSSIFEGDSKTSVQQVGGSESRTHERSLQVLLAEDGIVNQKMVTYLLKRKGHTVTIADLVEC